MTPEELSVHLVALQNARVELTERLRQLRDAGDQCSDAVRAMRAQLLPDACEALPAARGSDKPSDAKVKAYIDEHALMSGLSAESDHVARDKASVSDRLGSVRSALRVVGQLVEIKLRRVDGDEAEPSTDDDW